MNRDELYLSIIDLRKRVAAVTAIISIELRCSNETPLPLNKLIEHQLQLYSELRNLLITYGSSADEIEKFDEHLHQLKIGYLLHEMNIHLPPLR
ncbi:hypothetical protein [Mucilaginibacter pedocola]|uniref:Uncharacterized protein n=1 Tax=Mucilaginibacter pedocola TaxID=1792845 RepID=A0A1S9PHG3_9SPHI|nr:hypothetical protein [Mucilaginibacter pedocola]OOQ60402.1 hypothetical protein BC343_25640 [Mucilaginibacter pedocola]